MAKHLEVILDISSFLNLFIFQSRENSFKNSESLVPWMKLKLIPTIPDPIMASNLDHNSGPWITKGTLKSKFHNIKIFCTLKWHCLTISQNYNIQKHTFVSYFNEQYITYNPKNVLLRIT